MRHRALGSLYKSLFEDMLDGLAYCQMMFDDDENPADFILIEVNKNYEKLTGLKGVMGKKASDVVPKFRELNPEMFAAYVRVSETGRPERLEAYVRRLSRWFLVSVYSPRRHYFTVILQDITDRKQTEKDLEDAKIAARNVLEDLQNDKEALAHAKAKDEAMLASIGDGVIIVDLTGKVTFVNQAAEDMLGWRSSDMVGKAISDFIPIEDEKGTRMSEQVRPMTMRLSDKKGMDRPIRSEARNVSGLYYVRKDGTRFPVSMSLSRVMLEDKIVGAIEVFRDITKEKEVDKAKSEFVSLASHQLRTPLTTISWYTEMILKGDVGQVVPDQKRYLEKVYQGNKRMIELVNTLLDVSRIELGTFRIEPKPTNIIALARSVLDEQKPNIEKKKLIVSQRFGDNVPTFSTDPKLFRMVLQNLLSNAVAYTPPGGKIELSIFLDDKKSIGIQVSDTGYGIPKDQQSQIFTKLFRADNVRDKDSDGTGLGLYIAKSIVESSGGKIWFESEENKGTDFFVTFPIL